VRLPAGLGARLALALALVAGASRPSRGAESELGSAVRVVVWTTPVAGCVFTGAYTGLHLAYGEGVRRGWRTAGYVFGGASLLVGAASFYVVGADGATDYMTGGVPIVAGLGALALAWQVGDEDADLRAMVLPLTVAGGGGGVVVMGRF
jgi:hypothetical protein